MRKIIALLLAILLLVYMFPAVVDSYARKARLRKDE